ncbi:MAG: type I glyceraldehyde-3-phosphate dehydrogenase [Armatimonadota bacterium]|nr:MAG: type I glyceraldehyde-3-phosphate dehydrogenase [Armatimonadota bacterium]
MAVRIGINGFGRIGRQVLKALLEKYPAHEVVAINDITDAETNAHLFKYDSNYGIFPGAVEAKGDGLAINGKQIKVLSEKDPAKLPWKSLGVQLVLECTGVFTDVDKARAHVSGGGAQKVVISAPAKGDCPTIVLGVNEDTYDPAKADVISNASCTTNCLAPVCKVLNDSFGIEVGVMTTIHSYTNDQRILDLPHKDLRRARAAALNIIPTSTGAAKAIYLAIPELKGKLNGIALRVPTPTVSLVDLVVTLGKDASAEDINAAFKKAADGPMKGILEYSEEELVSMDLKGNEHSSIVDAGQTMVLAGRTAKVLAWYDNEWAYSVRLADLADFMAKKI